METSSIKRVKIITDIYRNQGIELDDILVCDFKILKKHSVSYLVNINRKPFTQFKFDINSDFVEEIDADIPVYDPEFIDKIKNQNTKPLSVGFGEKNKMKRICITFKDPSERHKEIAEFIYTTNDYTVQKDDQKKIKEYLDDNRYDFYDQTETESYSKNIKSELKMGGDLE